jgi:hypothetical protein
MVILVRFQNFYEFNNFINKTGETEKWYFCGPGLSESLLLISGPMP